MSVRWVKLVEQEQSVFTAALVAAGLDRDCFRAATGWDVAVERHRYEASAHWVSTGDDERLDRLVAEHASSQQGFRRDYVDRLRAHGRRLLETARSLAELAGNVAGRSTLEEGLTVLSAAMREMAPFVVAGPYVERAAGAFRADGHGRPEGGPESAAPARPPAARAEALKEMRDCYRIALDLATGAETADLLSSAAPAIIARRLDDFPDLSGRLRRHAQEYAWLWGPRCEGRSTTELLERIQSAALRWPAEALQEAAARVTTPEPEDLPGFGTQVHRQAECLAMPFFAAIAEMLGATRDHLMACTPQEIRSALRGAPLPDTDAERRVPGAFVVERSGDGVTVRAGDGAPSPASGPVAPARPVLDGISASRGLAVGTVTILLAGWDVGELAVGDVLVTATSSPDVLGGESMFPTRAGLRGIEKAAAIVTDEGGTLSHAGIVSREFRIPCVVGTGRATSLLRPGQVVEVDALRPAGRVTVLGA